jgi:hypothetical protein
MEDLLVLWSVVTVYHMIYFYILYFIFDLDNILYLYSTGSPSPMLRNVSEAYKKIAPSWGYWCTISDFAA